MNPLLRVLKDLSTIFSSLKTQKVLRDNLLKYLSEERGFQIFFEKKLDLSNINCLFPYGQNPFTSYCLKKEDKVSLFQKECRHKHCQGPCLFKHNGRNRISDLLSVTKFKLVIFNRLMVILDSEKILLDYREDSFEEFTENVFRFNAGIYPALKLHLMKSTYRGELLTEDNYYSTIPEVEHNIGLNFYKRNNQVSSRDLMFLLSCCYLPIWIVDTVYFIMKVNDQMTNHQIEEWKQEIHNFASSLLDSDDKFSLETIRNENLIYKFETEILRLSLNEQRRFRYLLSPEQQINKRNIILNSYIQVSEL